MTLTKNRLKIKELIESKLLDFRKQRRFCDEHKFELERLMYNKLCEEFDDLRFEIEQIYEET